MKLEYEEAVDALAVAEYQADVDEATAREALRLAMHKLPIKCKFAVREDSVKEDGTNEG